MVCQTADVRRIAYTFVKKIHHNFNTEEKMAGKKWLQQSQHRQKTNAVVRGSSLLQFQINNVL